MNDLDHVSSISADWTPQHMGPYISVQLQHKSNIYTLFLRLKDFEYNSSELYSNSSKISHLTGYMKQVYPMFCFCIQSSVSDQRRAASHRAAIRYKMPTPHMFSVVVKEKQTGKANLILHKAFS